jgi:DNA-binding response OmpR family regulator
MGNRILIVEDDPAIRMLVTAVLEAEGHEISEAADGLAALPAAQAERPDVVLLDIGLPGLDGFGVLAQLKEDPELRDVPVIMVTAWGAPELVEKARELGAHDYVQKPFDVTDLRDRVAAALGIPAPLALAA